jgi:hypothetical protein
MHGSIIDERAPQVNVPLRAFIPGEPRHRGGGVGKRLRPGYAAILAVVEVRHPLLCCPAIQLPGFDVRNAAESQVRYTVPVVAQLGRHGSYEFHDLGGDSSTITVLVSLLLICTCFGFRIRWSELRYN